MLAQCAVCGKEVAPADQKDHLSTNHLGPHYFWFNTKRYRTMEPSMRIGDIRRFVGDGNFYHVFEERDGSDIYHCDSEAVDLTRQPHFWSVPPATIFG